MNPSELTTAIKAKATALGFDLVGIAPAGRAPHADAYERWLASGYQAEMGWMGRDPTRRSDLRAVLPAARSLVVVGQSYFVQNPPPEYWNDPSRGRIARYAWGPDYHDVMLPKIKQLGQFVDELLGRSTEQKSYVDTGAILEKDHASLAGLGFVGKNSLLINPGFGSYVFLGELIVDVELEYDMPAVDGALKYQRGSKLKAESLEPVVFSRHPGLDPASHGYSPAFGQTRSRLVGRDDRNVGQDSGRAIPQLEENGRGAVSTKARIARCGSCSRCLDACPTGAIVAPYVVDSNKCISYHTIENKGEIPSEIAAKMGNWIYGCDLCQEVCPWVQQQSRVSATPFLHFDPELHTPRLSAILDWDEPEFLARYAGTPLKRLGLGRLQRNVRSVLSHSQLA